MSLITEITDPATSVATLAEVGENAHYGDEVTRHGNIAYQAGNYLDLPGVDGNHALSAWDAPAIMGDIELEFHVSRDFSGSSRMLYHQSNALRVQFASSNKMRLNRWDAAFAESTATLPVQGDVYLRVSHNVTTDLVQFFYSLDGEDWTQLGDDVPIGAYTATPNTSEVQIGAWNTIWPWIGKIHTVTVRDGIGGEALLDLDFSTFDRNSTTGKALTGQQVDIIQTDVGGEFAKITAEQLVSDAEQDTLNAQPVYLPKDEVNGTYLYLPRLAGNYLSIPAITLDWSKDVEIEFVYSQRSDNPNSIQGFFGEKSIASLACYMQSDVLNFRMGGTTESLNSARFPNMPINAQGSAGKFKILLSWDATLNEMSLTIDDVPFATRSVSDPLPFDLDTIGVAYIWELFGKLHSFRLTEDGVDKWDINISNDAQHGDTSFDATVGGTVTVNQSGANPASIIGRSVIRYDGDSNFMESVAKESITSGKVCFFIGTLNSTTAYRYILVMQNDANGTPLFAQSIILLQTRPNSAVSMRAFGAGSTGISEDGSTPLGKRFTREAQVRDDSSLNYLDGVGMSDNPVVWDYTNLSADSFYIGASRDSTNPTYNSFSAIDIESTLLFEDPGTPELREELRQGIESIYKTYPEP